MDQALVVYLRSTTAISSLVGERIEWGLRPQGSALPALGLKVVSRFPVSSDEGASGLWQGRVQFDCWAATQTAAKALKDALILSALPEGKRLEFVGGKFETWIENEFDRDPEDDKGGVPIFGVVVDIFFNHISD